MSKKCHEWMITYTGRKFYPSNPNPADIDIVDVAHGLSMICRFGGHVKEFYSVAQHSLIVSDLVPPQLKLIALLHDATEAYIGDCIRPLKVQLPQFNEVEARVWAAVCERFKISYGSYQNEAVVKAADNTALMTERRDLTNSNHFKWIKELEKIQPLRERIIAWPQQVAEQEFLRRFDELYGKNNS